MSSNLDQLGTFASWTAIAIILGTLGPALIDIDESHRVGFYSSGLAILFEGWAMFTYIFQWRAYSMCVLIVLLVLLLLLFLYVAYGIKQRDDTIRKR